MITLSNKETGTTLGSITQDDFDLLRDQLEEENLDDNDYYITSDTIDLLEGGGASVEVVAILRQAVGSSEGLDVVWNHEVTTEDTL